MAMPSRQDLPLVCERRPVEGRRSHRPGHAAVLFISRPSSFAPPLAPQPAAFLGASTNPGTNPLNVLPTHGSVRALNRSSPNSISLAQPRPVRPRASLIPWLLFIASIAASFFVLLAGRGHDGTEFQEAQAALGLSYSGHSADWLFLSLFVLAAALWFLRTRSRPTPRLVGRLVVGAVTALAVSVFLQSVNNAIFDPLFQPKTEHTHLLARG